MKKIKIAATVPTWKRLLILFSVIVFVSMGALLIEAILDFEYFIKNIWYTFASLFLVFLFFVFILKFFLIPDMEFSKIVITKETIDIFYTKNSELGKCVKRIKKIDIKSVDVMFIHSDTDKNKITKTWIDFNMEDSEMIMLSHIPTLDFWDMAETFPKNILKNKHEFPNFTFKLMTFDDYMRERAAEHEAFLSKIKA